MMTAVGSVRIAAETPTIIQVCDISRPRRGSRTPMAGLCSQCRAPSASPVAPVAVSSTARAWPTVPMTAAVLAKLVRKPRQPATNRARVGPASTAAAAFPVIPPAVGPRKITWSAVRGAGARQPELPRQLENPGALCRNKGPGNLQKSGTSPAIILDICGFPRSQEVHSHQGPEDRPITSNEDAGYLLASFPTQ